MRIGIIAIALLAPVSAAHAELPDPVRRIIEEAVQQGDPAKVKTVVEIARTTNPQASSEIDAIYEEFLHKLRNLQASNEHEKREQIRQAGLLDLWRGKGEIGAYHATGNSSNTGITAGLALSRKGIDWEHRVVARIDYLQTDSSKRLQVLASYRPRYNLGDAIFTYGLGQFESDEAQGFDARYSVSGGLGYRIIEADDMKLAVESGPAWRETDFTSDTSETQISGHGSLNFEWKVADNLKVSQDANAYLEKRNSTLAAITALEAGVSHGLVARLSYSVKHDTDPPQGAVGTDTMSRFTLVYEF